MFKPKPKKPDLRSVLFICTANITRSPAAQAMFRALTEKFGERWDIASAGIKAIDGMPAHPVMQFIMKMRETSLIDHRSKPVTKLLLNKYHWIVVMERVHLEAIIELESETSDRVFVFRDLVHFPPLDDPDMPDPTGLEADDYTRLLDILDAEIPLVYKALTNKVSDWEFRG